MILSILCVTINKYPSVGGFIEKMYTLAHGLNAEFVLGLDREKAQKADFRKLADIALDLKKKDTHMQEDVLDEVIGACSGDWVLRLDDDETISPALERWIFGGSYVSGNLFTFPRIYLYPDEKHFLNNPGIFPDLQTRLGRKEFMFGCNYAHAANPNGSGVTVDYAIEHHNLLVKDLAERRIIAAKCEAIQPGAGTLPQYARYNLPEDFYPDFEIQEYTNNGDFSTT